VYIYIYIVSNLNPKRIMEFPIHMYVDIYTYTYIYMYIYIYLNIYNFGEPKFSKVSSIVLLYSTFSSVMTLKNPYPVLTGKNCTTQTFKTSKQKVLAFPLVIAFPETQVEAFYSFLKIFLG